jgi:hypothetical protein
MANRKFSSEELAEMRHNPFVKMLLRTSLALQQSLKSTSGKGPGQESLSVK